MATWIQSLSWTLIYSFGQGLLVFALLRLALKSVPTASANVRYYLSLSALTALLAWFAATWWRGFHALSQAPALPQTSHADGTGISAATQYLAIDTGMRLSLSALFPWLCAGYVAGLLIMIARLFAGIWQLASLRTKDAFAPAATLDELLLSLRKRMAVTAPVRLLVSARAHVPMVIGVLKPVILVPASALAQLAPEELEAILLHELAHIRRHDYLVNILQTVAETVMFFNPFVWMISRTVRQEREYACDDMVIGHTVEPVSYAMALTTLASANTAISTVMVAASGQPKHLYERIQRIMGERRAQFSYSRVAASIIMLVAVTCSVVWAGPSFTKARKRGAMTVTANAADANAKPRAVPVARRENTRPAARKVADKPVIVKRNETPLTPAVEIPQENVLVQRLLEDRLIDQVKGFLVEKQQNELYINRERLADEIAQKYLRGITKDIMRMQVFSMEERMRMHPEAGFIQVLLPFTFESPCVDKKPAKEGC